MLSCLNSLSPESISTIVGAIIGGVLGFLGSASASVLLIINENHKRLKIVNDEYTSWLRGLESECDHICDCIKEIQSIIQESSSSGIPTKRLNIDFLASARIQIIKHARSNILFPDLTKAYRDTVHTNEMLDRLERQSLSGPRTTQQIESVSKSLDGVSASINKLKITVTEQASLVTQNAPRLLAL